MTKRHTVRALIIKDGRLLVFERWRVNANGKKLHYYSIPGGGVEPGETPEQAVVRELQEEMLINITVDTFLMHQETERRNNEYYLCHIIDGEPTFNLESEEASESSENNVYRVAWLPLQSDSYSQMYPEYQSAVKAFLASDETTTWPIDISVQN